MDDLLCSLPILAIPTAETGDVDRYAISLDGLLIEFRKNNKNLIRSNNHEKIN